MSPADTNVAVKSRLLVVDDSRAMRAIIRRALECKSLGPTEIQVVADGEAALDLLESFAPQLIVSDWHMPRVSGIELLQTIRQMGHAELKLGFVTTETSPALLQQAVTNGASFILHKPFRDDELVAAVSAVLRPLAARPTEAQAAEAPTLTDPAGAAKVMRRLVQAWMPGVPFRVIEGDKFTGPHLSAQNLLAMYSASSGGGVTVLAAANMPALCMLGGGAIQADVKDVRRAIQDNNPTPDMIESAIAFFRELTELLPHQLPVGGSIFKGANLVPKDHAQLRAAVAEATVRVDYRLAVPGYGDGRLVLIRA